VALLLGAMLALSFLQIILRNVAGTGILWIDPLLRHLLLWVGFAGATLATRLDRHINVDAVTRLLRGPALRTVRTTTHLVAASVAIVLSGACWAAMRDELAAGTTSFLDLPTGWLQAVMPVSLFVMAVRFLRHAVDASRGVIAPAPGAQNGGRPA